MIKVKTTRRNVKRAVSPLQAATDISGSVLLTNLAQPTPSEPEIVQKPPAGTFEKQYTSFFEAESAASQLQKPWLRLERGIRLQRYRAFAEAYPGLTTAEKDNLYKVLLKANDARLLNTKTQIVYENGVIQAIKGLKIIKTGDPTVPATFKIDVGRATKKQSQTLSESAES